MTSEKFLEKVKKEGIDTADLTSIDIKTLIEMNLKGQFENEIFRNYLKESNITYKTLIEGLSAFIDTHKPSSNKYLEILDNRINSLMKQAENAKTDEQKERLDYQIDLILDRLKKEVNENRIHSQKLALIAGSMATMIAGGALFLVTRNPEVLKKGTEMIAKETFKQIMR